MTDLASGAASFSPKKLMDWMKKKSSLVDKLQQLHEQLKSVDVRSLVYSEMTKKVGAELLGHEVTKHTRGTIFVSLSRCEKLLAFMRETDKGWISDLQGEGDQESISLASELNRAYDQLNFMMEAGSLSGDDIVAKVAELYRNDQTTDERYERLSTKLD